MSIAFAAAVPSALCPQSRGPFLIWCRPSCWLALLDAATVSAIAAGSQQSTATASWKGCPRRQGSRFGQHCQRRAIVDRKLLIDPM